MYIGHASFVTVLPSFRATREAKTFQPGPSFLFGRIPRRKLRRFRENRCPPGKTMFGKTKRIHGVILNRGIVFSSRNSEKTQISFAFRLKFRDSGCMLFSLWFLALACGNKPKNDDPVSGERIASWNSRTAHCRYRRRKLRRPRTRHRPERRSRVPAAGSDAPDGSCSCLRS